MRIRPRVPLATLALLLPAVVLGAGPAAAKVPGTAVLTSVATGRTTGLDSSSPDHMPLATALVLNDDSGTPDPPGPMADRAVAGSVTVRWHLEAGGPLFQVDQVFPDTGDGVWVRTDSAPYVADDDVLWHRAPASLGPLLARLGLFEPDEPGEWPKQAGTAPAGGEGAAEAWWWALPGLAAGSVSTALGRRWWSHRRPDAGPAN
ncbi:hypothetical protein [Streptomyces sp. MI02-7b]|uniref:hypothetical protein n=1 Tax=Streptomyces sp. MI02-7b TaxID=462941 RepID=UPI0029A04E32|nr:hypothetical protein [Streptomyces sp. MI02-7b]MDX3071914.1 hypothetical protein [Streptomyces sp. MI02-7b]